MTKCKACGKELGEKKFHGTVECIEEIERARLNNEKD
jgi:hypothetical protein